MTAPTPAVQETAEAPAEAMTWRLLDPRSYSPRRSRLAGPREARAVVRKVTAGDRLKIIGLSRNAEAALRENRLMSPPGDNAYALYQQILKIDPNNADATSGMRSIASRYVAMAARAIDLGEPAETYVDRARRRTTDSRASSRSRSGSGTRAPRRRSPCEVLPSGRSVCGASSCSSDSREEACWANRLERR